VIRRLFRDWLDGLRAGFDVLWWGYAYPRTLPLRRGGSMPAYRPAVDEQRAILSPGRVSPEVADRFPPEFIARINRGRQP
jgi:hypothetical protein